MTIQLGDTGKVAYGSLKTFTISLATPYENLNASPIALGTSMPGTPTDSYTVAAGDFPTISPGAISNVYNGLLTLGGKNTVATAYALYYQINKNGTNVISGNASVSASQYWTLSIYHSALNNIAAGDKLDIYLYGAASSSFNYDYLGWIIYPSRFVLSKSLITKDVTYTLSGTTAGHLTKGTPSIAYTGNFYLFPTTDGTNNWPLSSSVTSATGFTCNPNAAGYGLGRVQYTDNQQNSFMQSNATYRPYYYNNNIPTKITFREILR